MSELSQLSPQPLWDIFAKIAPSRTRPITKNSSPSILWVGQKKKAYMRNATRVGNILIRKGATAGMENRKPVALQAHLDMVPQKITTPSTTSLKIRSSRTLTANG
ncbi:aminoacyl-histidine dipeptidase [Klebsiella pneumoniae]|uniref:Aminoacyl-histidine dipeptidase n=1 Tax=Klebsiella pneumoniae TaxID=573 RepID=A0A377UU92_KLEPN|nr:aminoacyl-histidine dipeptidase [Klebsiella pneumoniae]